MKRFSKAVLSMLLVASLVFVLASCSSTKEETKAPEIVTPASTGSSSSAPAPAPAPASAPAASSAENKVLPSNTPIVKNTQGDSEFDLFIIHTNDVHARVNAGEDGSMGYAKMNTLLNVARDITDNILLLDAGDVTHGTNFANVFNGEPIAVLLDMMGYDAVAPGNHDFNYGTDSLLEKAAEAEEYSDLKILAANIFDEDGNMLFQPYQLYDFNGFTVAVVGLATPDTKEKSHPKNTEGVYFADFMNDEDLAIAQEALDELHEVADFVVVLGHIGLVPDGSIGLTSDYLAKNLNGIDVFIDGHSHTELPDGLMVNGTLIASTGQYLNNLGVVLVHVKDGVGTVQGATLIPASVILDPSTSPLLTQYNITEIPGDPAIEAYISEVNDELEKRYSVVVATIPEDLDGERENVRTKPTNLSKLITDAITDYTGADFTIINGGGIRASLSKGDVTLGDVNSVLPFTNTISVCQITPAEAYAAFEHGYSLLPETNGAFSQSDLDVEFTPYAPVGERILSLKLNGKELDRNDTTTLLTVATNDFMAAGGDGYTMFGKEVMVGPMLNEVFVEYLGELYPPQN